MASIWVPYTSIEAPHILYNTLHELESVFPRDFIGHGFLIRTTSGTILDRRLCPLSRVATEG